MSIKKQSLRFYFFILHLIFINMSYAGVHDPTKPAITFEAHNNATVDDNYNLQSILIGPMRRLAMINGQLVGTGSMVQGARVLAIDKNHVVLFYDGRKKVLHLFGARLWKAN